MKADDIIGMTDAARRRMGVRTRRKRGKYKSEKRCRRSRDEMISYLRDNDFRTSRQLKDGRKDGEPNVYDYKREFGKWSVAIEASFGPPKKPGIEYDAEYVAKAVIEFGLWTSRRYREKHNQNPTIIPSLNQVRRRWGAFSNLTAYAKKHSMSVVLDEYLKLKRRFGRVPTKKECDYHGVDLESPIKFFGNKRLMDNFLTDMESKK